jgi:uncharacterized protein (TIGR02270 family)
MRSSPRALAGAAPPQSEHGRTARLAAEAFSAITGLAIEGPFLRAEEPEPEEPPPFEEEDWEADLVEGPDAVLPLANASKVQRWWKERRTNFGAIGRHLRGQPNTIATLFEELERGPMRRRPAHALEVSIRSQGKVRIITSGWARSQALTLEALRKVDVAKPFREFLREA